MKRTIIAAMTLLMALMAQAQTVSSPNGKVTLKFWLQDGRPTYELNYKRP